MGYRVTFTNRDVTVDVNPGETVLQAADRLGVPLLAGCRAGACLTCAARLHRGRIHMPQGTALTQEMLDAGVVLPCVCTVEGDALLQLGEPGRTLLHPRHVKAWTD